MVQVEIIRDDLPVPKGKKVKVANDLAIRLIRDGKAKEYKRKRSKKQSDKEDADSD